MEYAWQGILHVVGLEWSIGAEFYVLACEKICVRSILV
jgi:hypothetical protein